ncbi:MAG: hypothetical protein JSV99_00460 [Planctomycetota bacterium]|nr:MAG: hypothetical protein JSV99_00460 [Planctomycetota bacterium]
MKLITVRILSLSTILAGCLGCGRPSVLIRTTERLQFKGVYVLIDPNDPNTATYAVDCSSPAHWDGDTMYIFYAWGHPFRASGPNVSHLSTDTQRVTFDNESTWKMGNRWSESTHKTDDGKLYMWYHNEPPRWPATTAPRIGAMVSDDNGLNFRDLGIVLEAPPGSNNPQTANKYFKGGNGDFVVVADREKQYFYFFISTYHKTKSEQGVSIARMRYNDREDPKGRVFKWHNGKWSEPGLGGKVTPIFPAAVDWHRPDADAFWGPSVHFNTYLNCWVMLLNRAIDKDWSQEGIYISYNSDLANPSGWTKPKKILDAAELENSKWYPQVIGLDKEKRETDKLASKNARLFVAGLSKWKLIFQNSH